MSIYTKSERTVKKYTVEQAVNSALVRLNKIGLTQVCTDKIKGRNNDEKITLEELNRISDELYDDTIYYDGYKATW